MMQAGNPGGRFILMPAAVPISIPRTRTPKTGSRPFIDTVPECAEY